MHFVENEIVFWEQIRQIRNHELNKKGFIQQHEITPEEHDSHMKSHGACYYVCLEDNVQGYGSTTRVLGYCGVIDNDIRVAVAPSEHGKGVGTFMINELMKRHPHSFAKVKLENAASLALFEKCGFKKKYYILEKE